MADINKRGASDCDGEGGERGERGKRGHRGHRGLDGATGPTAGTEPPFWPQFPVIPPYNITTIYARSTGSDASGNGSLANPYATFQRAVRDVPPAINPGYRVIIDITDLGVETLPQDWSCPPIKSAQFAWADDASPVPYFAIATPFTIRAIPKLGLPGTDAIVGAGDGGVVATVGPDLCTVMIAVPRAAWVPGSLKGKQVIKTLSSRIATSCIFDNTTDTLFLCNDAASFNGGVEALVLAPGETLNIVEPSATLQAPAATNFSKDPIEFSGMDAVNFQGIQFQSTNPNTGEGSLGIGAMVQPFFELCVCNELDVLGCNGVQVGVSATTVRGYMDAYSSVVLTAGRCFFENVGTTYHFGFTASAAQFRRVVFEGCSPIGSDDSGFEHPALPLSFFFKRCWLKNCGQPNGAGAPAGDALAILAPTRLDMDTCQIDDTAAGNAIGVDGLSQVSLVAVTGTGNLGFGILANNGAQVDAAAGGSSVTGAAGDLKSGALPASTYGALQQYDITAVGAGGATGTGTRIF